MANSHTRNRYTRFCLIKCKDLPGLREPHKLLIKKVAIRPLLTQIAKMMPVVVVSRVHSNVMASQITRCLLRHRQPADAATMIQRPRHRPNTRTSEFDLSVKTIKQNTKLLQETVAILALTL
uniref:Uncharacterized protein n=1 Tax=Echinococcus granulosus TaxID=6210 RepID=A0A068WXK0_ECHGR|nr:hypothetical protein EgrG_000296400 [Echinococcus granulosus]